MIDLGKVANALAFLSTSLAQVRPGTVNYKQNPKC